MKRIVEKIKDFILKSPATFFAFAGLIAIIIVRILDSYDEDFSLHDILVEAHGLIYDLFMFGVLLSIYEKLKEKKDRIERLKDEIDDYRGWDEKEAMYRIVGNIKRLNKEGVEKIDLSRAYLFGANLGVADLRGANLMRANLGGANLYGANLGGANLGGADLRVADLRVADLTSTKLTYADLTGAKLTNAKLVNAKLMKADLRSADLRGTDLMDAKLIDADLTGADLTGADLTGAVVLNKEWIQDLKSKNVIGAEKIEQEYEVVAMNHCFIIVKKTS